MRVLLVTPFPPHRDGIATYAAQELRQMRSEARPGGDTIEVLSPVPSAARWHLKLGSPTGTAQLCRKAAAYDRTVVQFSPEMFFGGCHSAAQRVAVWMGLAALARCTAVEYRLHEVEYGPLEANPLERRAAAMALGLATKVTVHTEAERDELDRFTGLGRRIEVIDHGRDFRPAVVRTRNRARAELNLPTDQFIFLAIGFLQHHKGFDRAVAAMELVNRSLDAGTGPVATGDGPVAVVGRPNLQLHIVGSARVDHPDIVDYVNDLARHCERISNATLHRRFVADSEFDLWLQAADTVIVPYREIWSSGVVERAALFDRQLIASDLPQLRDQAPTDTVFFSSTQELANSMEQLGSAWHRVNGPVAAGTPASGNPASGIGAAGEGVEGADGAGSDAEDGGGRQPADPGWTISLDQPDRLAIEAQVIARARASELGRLSNIDEGELADGGETAMAGPAEAGLGQRRPVDGLLSLGHLHRPTPTSARPGVAPLKRVIHRLIDWQIEPLASRIIDLQRATTQAVAELEQRQAQRPASTSADSTRTGSTPVRAGADLTERDEVR